VVTQGTRIPPGSVVVGAPANVRRHVEDFDLEKIRHSSAHYVEFARQYRAQA
jgi:carbonic anhydrase/acetyltransferase-like protein (isoleucine patch superfamily)